MPAGLTRAYVRRPLLRIEGNKGYRREIKWQIFKPPAKVSNENFNPACSLSARGSGRQYLGRDWGESTGNYLMRESPAIFKERFCNENKRGLRVAGKLYHDTFVSFQPSSYG